MAKTRTAIPKPVQEQVLNEYNHLCAVCGKERPQLHHIDEDPSNHDPMNLIPLCPNNHLIDVHNPTQPIEPELIKLLRKFKDPTVLTSQFHPLFVRVRFLDELEHKTDGISLTEKVSELVEFVKELEMGSFYASRIQKILSEPAYWGLNPFYGPSNPQELFEEKKRQEEYSSTYREQLRNARDQIYSLIVELLRFQPWRLEIKNPVDRGTR